MGLCAQKLERFGEAIAAYQKVLTQPADKLGAEERGQIEQDLKALTTAVAWLELTTSETTATITDRRVSSTPIVNVYQVPGGKKKLGVSPGTHELTASAPGQPDRVWTTTLTSGQSGSHHFDFSKSDAPTHRPLPTSVWVIGATSLGLVVAGGTLVGVSVSKSAAKDEAIKRHALPQEIDKLEKEAVAYTAAGGATLGLAGVGLVTATVLGVTRPEVPVAGGRLPMRVLPQIALGMVGATLLARW
jgi:hypothetical protein